MADLRALPLRTLTTGSSSVYDDEAVSAFALLGPAEVRRIAAAIGLRPSKARGQNFVIDANTVRRIVRLAALEVDDVVLEVGPGVGSLTLGLLPAVRQLIAVEVDEALAAALPQTVSSYAATCSDRLLTMNADALTVDALPGDLPTALVANLPYNVAVPVLLHLLERFDSLRHGLVMVQREVADRLVAAPGSRVYGVPTVKLAWYATARRVGGVVSRHVFWPAPNVDSALVAWERQPPPATDVTREQVFSVVDAAFAQRRKSLRASLAPWAGDAEAAERILRTASVDPSTRAERLTLSDFVRIASAAPATS